MLCDHNIGQGHLRSTGKKGQTKKSGFGAVIYVFRSDFCKEREHFLKRQNRYFLGKSRLSPEMT